MSTPFRRGDLVLWRNRCPAIVVNDGSLDGPAYIRIGHRRSEPLNECSGLVTDEWLRAMKPTRAGAERNELTLEELLEMLSWLIPYGQDDDSEMETVAAKNFDRIWEILDKLRQDQGVNLTKGRKRHDRT